MNRSEKWISLSPFFYEVNGGDGALCRAMHGHKDLSWRLLEPPPWKWGQIRIEGRLFFAPIARGNLQVHWPEGNVIIRRGIVSEVGGVPDYNAQAQVEKI